MNDMQIGTLMLYSAICAWTDWKSREISLRLSAAAGLIGLFGMLPVSETGSLTAVLPALLPGLVLAIVSSLSGGCIGMGDAVFLLVLGFFLKPVQILTILMIGCFLCAVWGLGLLIHRHLILGQHKIRDGLPFVTAAFPAVLMVAAGYLR